MTVDERLRIVDHIIDYVYVDFKALSAQEKGVVVSDSLKKR
jgi:hypothetical protein